MSRKMTMNPAQMAYERHLESIGRSPSTIEGHRRRISRLFTFLANELEVPVETIDLRAVIPYRLSADGPVMAHTPIDRQVIEQFLATCTQHVEDDGRRGLIRNLTLRSLRLFFDHEVENERFERNPTKGIRRARLPYRITGRKYLTREETKRIIAAARDSGNRERDYTLVMTIRHSGIRPGEARNLTVADLDFEHRMLMVKGKTGRRAAAMVDGLAMVLQEYLKSPYYREMSQGRRSFPLFPNKSGGVMSGHDLRRIISRLAKAAEIPIRVTPYTLRHTFATLAYEAGVSFAVVSQALGHRRMQNSFFYVHTWNKRLWKLSEENPASKPLERVFDWYTREQGWRYQSKLPISPGCNAPTDKIIRSGYAGGGRG